MRIRLHHLRFNRSLERNLLETSISVHKHNSTIILGIYFFSFFILNPFFAIFIMALFSLLVSGNSKSILFMLTIALTIFYSSRNIGVSWGSGGDDAPSYILNYQDNLHYSLVDIFHRSTSPGKSPEILYFGFWWIIGKVFGSEPRTFVFLIYLTQVTLLGITAYLVSRRYAIIFIFVFYFGLFDPNHQILHLWRVSFAFFIFLVGISIYFKGNKKIGRLLIYSASGFHVSIIVCIIIFELFVYLIKKRNFFQTIVVGAIIFAILTFFWKALIIYFSSKAAGIFFYSIESSLGVRRLILYGIVLIIMIYAHTKYKLSPISQFSSFLFIMYLILLFQLGLNNPIMTRLIQIMVPIVGIVFFEIVMKQSKGIIVFIIIILFLHVIISPSSEMFLQMIPEYKDPFYGIFNILYF